MAPNREIEVKLPVRELAEVLGRLRGMRARRVARLYERNILFDTPDSYFQRQHSILRIRMEEETDSPRNSPSFRPGDARSGLLTFKCPPKGTPKGGGMRRARYKERVEIEYRLPDVRRFARLLRRLGLRPWFEYEKYRSQYRIAGSALQIDLDETPIGIFLELEGSPRSIDRAARALGYSARDYITASYLELYAAECSRRDEPVCEYGLFEEKKCKFAHSVLDKVSICS